MHTYRAAAAGFYLMYPTHRIGHVPRPAAAAAIAVLEVPPANRVVDLTITMAAG